MIRFSRMFWLALFPLYPAVVATSAAEVTFENLKTIDDFESIFEQGRTQEILFEDWMHRLGRIKDPRAITPMLESLTERENWIRPLSSRHSVPTASTFVISFPGTYAVPPLIAGLDHENEMVRMGPEVAFAHLRFPEVTATPAVEALIEPLEDPNAEVGGYTALSHGTVQDERAIEPFLKIAENTAESTDVRMEVTRALTRISHQPSAAADDAPHPVGFSHFGVLDVLSSTTPRPSDRKPHWARHLADLATKDGEMCGLTAFRDPRVNILRRQFQEDPNEDEPLKQSTPSGWDHYKSIWGVDDEDIEKGLNQKVLKKRVQFAAELVAMDGDPRAVNSLLEGLQSEDPEIREIALRACRHFVIQYLDLMTSFKPEFFAVIYTDQSETDENRRLAGEYLFELKGEGAADAFISVIKNEHNTNARIVDRTMEALIGMLGFRENMPGFLFYLLDRPDPKLHQIIFAEMLPKEAGVDYGNDYDKWRKWITDCVEDAEVAHDCQMLFADGGRPKRKTREQTVDRKKAVTKETQPVEDSPLSLELRSNKRVYKIAESIIIEARLKNVSKEKISISTRGLDSDLEPLCKLHDANGNRIPWGAAMQLRPSKKNDFKVLEPSKSTMFRFDVMSKDLGYQSLESGAYILQCFYVSDDAYYDNSSLPAILRGVKYGWRGEIASNKICFSIEKLGAGVDAQ